MAWIFGSSRSGSTWLLRMLADLDGVVPIDDPHLGHHLGVWRPIPLAWAASEEPGELTTLLELMAEEPGYFFSARHRDAWWEPLRELIRARFEAEASERRSPAAGNGGGRPLTYVVKEPGSHAAPLLAELFPASKLIFLLRDGRDVVDSWLDAYQEGAWAIRKGAFAVSPRGRISLIRWLSAVWAYRCRAVWEAFETRPPENRVMVRYEQLRARPLEALEAISGTLGLDPEGIPAAIDRHSFERLPVQARGSKREARSARPGGWRVNLTPAEQEAMHEVLGPALAEFGYERARSGELIGAR